MQRHLARALRLPRPPALLRRSLSTAAPPPPAGGVPLAPGEFLLHTSGPTSMTKIMRGWMPFFVTSTYLAVVKTADWFTPDVAPLLSPTFTALFAALSAGSYVLAQGTTQSCVRALVLTADGQAVRVYPFGRLLGFGLGRPVTVPLKLLRENVDFTKAGSAAASDLFIQARAGGLAGKWSYSHLVIDKPPADVVPRLAAPGSGLAFTPRGVAPATLAALADAAAAGGGALALNTPADKLALRAYVLLVWVLQGNCVAAMDKLHAGAWRAESIGVDLGEAGLGNSKAGRAYQQAALAAQWREARDAESGRAYFYNILTWETRWQHPYPALAAPAEQPPQPAKR